MLLTVQELPLRAQTWHCVISGGIPSRVPVGSSDVCQTVEPDHVFAASPVCAVLTPRPRRRMKGTTAPLPWSGCAMAGLHGPLGWEKGRMLTWRELDTD